MKKLINTAIALSLVLCLSGCKSTKQKPAAAPTAEEQAQEKTEEGQEQAEEGEAQSQDSENGGEAPEEQGQEQPQKQDRNKKDKSPKKQAEQAPEEEEDKSIDAEAVNKAVKLEEETLIESPFVVVEQATPKNYMGWIGGGATKGTVENQVGAVKIRAKGKHGSFNIYSMDSNGKSTPVFSTSEEFTTTSFYLLAGKKIYKLSGGNDGISLAEKTPSGIRILYSIPDVADVLIDFSIFKSDSKYDEDMVKITSKIRGKSKRITMYGLKLVMDTAIGEKSKYHFYNSDNMPIKSEVMYRSMQKTRWLLTKNDNTALQILLSGADIDPVDFVAVANYETLNTLSWEPNMLSERSFNTVRSYNNSAVGINWICQNLGIDEEMSSVFYLALACDSASPRGEEFLIANTKSLEVEPEKDLEPLEEDDPLKKPSINFDVDKKTKFSMEYVQRLIDRIAELEEDDPALNQDELMILNEEIDYILEELRKQ